MQARSPALGTEPSDPNASNTMSFMGLDHSKIYDKEEIEKLKRMAESTTNIEFEEEEKLMNTKWFFEFKQMGHG